MMDSETLRLRGSHPPASLAVRSVPVAVKLRPHVLAWLDEEAEREGCHRAHIIRRAIDAAMDERWPADVVHWLRCQAAQSGVRGDVDAALILVVRHLAESWPAGCRLDD